MVEGGFLHRMDTIPGAPKPVQVAILVMEDHQAGGRDGASHHKPRMDQPILAGEVNETI